jgi:predicted RNA-binding Zn ribbon-like protein
MRAHEEPFELTGGSPCLDLVNTVSRRPTGRPEDHLRRYSDLVAWAEQSRLLTAGEALRLRRDAARRPGPASRALERARSLREALYALFSSVAADRRPPPDALAALNTALGPSLAQLRLEPSTRGFTWRFAHSDSLDRILWPVVRSAAELVTSDDVHRVRECAGRSCAWLFLDHSRNHKRRWCDMRVCGNREKARRFYERVKKKEGKTTRTETRSETSR